MDGVEPRNSNRRKQYARALGLLVLAAGQLPAERAAEGVIDRMSDAADAILVRLKEYDA